MFTLMYKASISYMMQMCCLSRPLVSLHTGNTFELKSTEQMGGDYRLHNFIQ